MACGCKDPGDTGGWNLIHDNVPMLDPGPPLAPAPADLAPRAARAHRHWPWWIWVVAGVVAWYWLGGRR